MFASVIREGQRVKTPSGREWIVVGWEDQRRRVLLLNALTGDEVSLPPHMLTHVSSENAGELLALEMDEVKHELSNDPR